MDHLSCPSSEQDSNSGSAMHSRSRSRSSHSRELSATQMLVTESLNSESNVDSAIFYSILVHVVTHADFHASLRISSKSHPRFSMDQLLARPNFSSFDPICRMLMEALENQQVAVEPLEYPSNDGKSRIPVGVVFQPPLKIPATIADWRLRSKDWSKFSLLRNQDKTPFSAEENIEVEITGIYFPIIAVLLPIWQRLVSAPSRSKRVSLFYLITGSGMPRNPMHNPQGNCTEALAHLIVDRFLTRFYPELETSIVHSGPGMYSYAANVKFMNGVFRPIIARKRMELARLFGDGWPSRFHVMLSLLNGSAARSQALNACLRQFNPDCLHVAEPKTMWHSYPNVPRLWEDDIELLRFETAEMSPPIELSDLSADCQMLVWEMIKHRNRLEDAVSGRKISHSFLPGGGYSRNRSRTDSRASPPSNELETFWLRKTKQPVLSVLMTQKENEPPRFFPGINIEVSMPTGSLCAERSAIGAALAADPTLKRSDMKRIAVLSMTLSSSSSSTSSAATAEEAKEELVRRRRANSALNPISPCGACREWLKKIAAVNPDFSVLTFTDMDCGQAFLHPVLP